MAKNDERTEEFNYSLIYNDVTLKKEKRKVEAPKLKLKLYNAGGVFALLAIILLTILYFIANGVIEDLKKKQLEKRIEEDPEFDVENQPMSRYDVILNLIVLGYNIAIILLGDFFMKRTYDIVELNNFQYQADYDNTLITFLFSFNSVNFYLSTFLVAILS